MHIIVSDIHLKQLIHYNKQKSGAGVRASGIQEWAGPDHGGY
jgi:hypothetical protein